MTKRKSPLFAHPYLYLSLHTGTSTPYAVKINVKRLIGLLCLLGMSIGAAMLGSLLFFRELEVNRKLTEKVLSFETATALRSALEQREAQPVTPAPEAKEGEPVSQPRQVAAAPTQTAPVVSKTTAQARIAALSTTCNEQGCGARLSMVPSGTGPVSGQLLIVLETEIPRIGTGNPTSSVRKRFFIYPGNLTQDELEANQIPKFTRKRFRFTRALTTTANFPVGKLLRPLAMNVYLFDSEGNRTHHERRVIEKD